MCNGAGALALNGLAQSSDKPLLLHANFPNGQNMSSAQTLMPDGYTER